VLVERREQRLHRPLITHCHQTLLTSRTIKKEEHRRYVQFQEPPTAAISLRSRPINDGQDTTCT